MDEVGKEIKQTNKKTPTNNVIDTDNSMVITGVERGWGEVEEGK